MSTNPSQIRVTFYDRQEVREAKAELAQMLGVDLVEETSDEVQQWADQTANLIFRPWLRLLAWTLVLTVIGVRSFWLAGFIVLSKVLAGIGILVMAVVLGLLANHSKVFRRAWDRAWEQRYPGIHEYLGE